MDVRKTLINLSSDKRLLDRRGGYLSLHIFNSGD